MSSVIPLHWRQIVEAMDGPYDARLRQEALDMARARPQLEALERQLEADASIVLRLHRLEAQTRLAAMQEGRLRMAYLTAAESVERERCMAARDDWSTKLARAAGDPRLRVEELTEPRAAHSPLRHTTALIAAAAAQRRDPFRFKTRWALQQAAVAETAGAGGWLNTLLSTQAVLAMRDAECTGSTMATLRAEFPGSVGNPLGVVASGNGGDAPATLPGPSALGPPILVTPTGFQSRGRNLQSIQDLTPLDWLAKLDASHQDTHPFVAEWQQSILLTDSPFAQTGVLEDTPERTRLTNNMKALYERARTPLYQSSTDTKRDGMFRKELAANVYQGTMTHGALLVGRGNSEAAHLLRPYIGVKDFVNPTAPPYQVRRHGEWVTHVDPDVAFFPFAYLRRLALLDPDPEKKALVHYFEKCAEVINVLENYGDEDKKAKQREMSQHMRDPDERLLVLHLPPATVARFVSLEMQTVYRLRHQRRIPVDRADAAQSLLFDVSTVDPDLAHALSLSEVDELIFAPGASFRPDMFARVVWQRPRLYRYDQGTNGHVEHAGAKASFFYEHKGNSRHYTPLMGPLFRYTGGSYQLDPNEGTYVQDRSNPPRYAPLDGTLFRYDRVARRFVQDNAEGVYFRDPWHRGEFLPLPGLDVAGYNNYATQLAVRFNSNSWIAGFALRSFVNMPARQAWGRKIVTSLVLSAVLGPALFGQGTRLVLALGHVAHAQQYAWPSTSRAFMLNFVVLPWMTLAANVVLAGSFMPAWLAGVAGLVAACTAVYWRTTRRTVIREGEIFRRLFSAVHDLEGYKPDNPTVPQPIPAPVAHPSNPGWYSGDPKYSSISFDEHAMRMGMWTDLGTPSLHLAVAATESFMTIPETERALDALAQTEGVRHYPAHGTVADKVESLKAQVPHAVAPILSAFLGELNDAHQLAAAQAARLAKDRATIQSMSTGSYYSNLNTVLHHLPAGLVDTAAERKELSGQSMSATLDAISEANVATLHPKLREAYRVIQAATSLRDHPDQAATSPPSAPPPPSVSLPPPPLPSVDTAARITVVPSSAPSSVWALGCKTLENVCEASRPSLTLLPHWHTAGKACTSLFTSAAAQLDVVQFILDGNVLGFHPVSARLRAKLLPLTKGLLGQAAANLRNEGRNVAGPLAIYAATSFYVYESDPALQGWMVGLWWLPFVATAAWDLARRVLDDWQQDAMDTAAGVQATARTAPKNLLGLRQLGLLALFRREPSEMPLMGVGWAMTTVMARMIQFGVGAWAFSTLFLQAKSLDFTLSYNWQLIGAGFLWDFMTGLRVATAASGPSFYADPMGWMYGLLPTLEAAWRDPTRLLSSAMVSAGIALVTAFFQTAAENGGASLVIGGMTILVTLRLALTLTGTGKIWGRGPILYLVNKAIRTGMDWLLAMSPRYQIVLTALEMGGSVLRTNPSSWFGTTMATGEAETTKKKKLDTDAGVVTSTAPRSLRPWSSEAFFASLRLLTDERMLVATQAISATGKSSILLPPILDM